MLDNAMRQQEVGSAATPDFEDLVGSDGWRRLRPAIRTRFGHCPRDGEVIRYSGVMQVVEASWVGSLLVRLCRVFGTPFAPFQGKNVPMSINLLSNAVDGAIIWEREYRYEGRVPVRVRSLKTKAKDGGLREWVDGGFGMSLDVFESGGALHFVSRRYYWRAGRFELALPRIFWPGKVHVIHEDLGGGRFRFAMTVIHGLFGRLFRQDGEFAPEGGAA
jgi:hypothetical protein